jgi:hypothetical protein
MTLERDCRAAPFAVTSAIYGWMLHTRFYADHDVADSEYERLKAELADIVGRIPDVNDPDIDARLQRVAEAIKRILT